MALAIHITKHHAGFGHRHLIAFAAHVFQENGQVQFAPSSDFKNTFFVGFLHAQRHIVLKLFLQAVPELATGDVLAFTPSQWRGVDAEVHDKRRLINLEHR